LRVKTFLSAWWERLSTSYWFIPSVMTIVATAFSFATVHIDSMINTKWARTAGWIWAGGPEGARNVLATVAGSTITVAGVVFSITIVALTLASSQFGPRLLRNFMNDRATQVVLGVFVSTFLYSLLVLRTIRGTDSNSFVPYLSVTCGLVFAVASVGFLIFFIHHVPSSILAENLIGRVARELLEGIDRLYPDMIGTGEKENDELQSETLPGDFAKEARQLESKESGFIQAIAEDRLLKLATEEHLILRLRRRPGHFVAEGAPLAAGWPADRINDEVGRKFREAFLLGRQRTPTQDVESSIDQLVEVAVRALSPGVNDPFTAISCLEWLGVALIRIGGRRIPSPYRYDKEGHLRVVTETTDFAGLAAAALNQIRQYGRGSIAVVVHLLDVVARVGEQLPQAKDRATLLQHARAVRDDGLAAAQNERDQRDIETRFAAAQSVLTRAR
jgi:uncharacterized membrane protein